MTFSTSEYAQEILQSHNADQPTAPRNTEHSHRTLTVARNKTIKATSSLFLVKMISKLEGHKVSHTKTKTNTEHAFSKPSLLNLIHVSKDTNVLFYLSVYKLIHRSNLRLWRYYQFSCRFNVIDDVVQKVQRHDDLIKAHVMR